MTAISNSSRSSSARCQSALSKTSVCAATSKSFVIHSPTPRKADYVWTTLARVLSFAKDRGKIAVNVCERGGRLYDADRAEIVWTADDIREFCAVASPELRAALLLALWTGQRQGDLLKLT